MKKINWPPEFDGIKTNGQQILGRVKNTDIWIELIPLATEIEISDELQEIIGVWTDLKDISLSE